MRDGNEINPGIEPNALWAREREMKMSDVKTGGVGFAGLLTVAFIVLKLCNVINWRWAWVFAPMWIPLGIVLGVLSIVGIVFLGAMILDKVKPKRRKKKKA